MQASGNQISKLGEEFLPIPNRINLFLVCLDLLVAISLLKVASVGSAWVATVSAVAFAYLMLTNYSLAHEAAHQKLHSNRRWNYAIGLIPATLFPMSLTLLMNSHERHHTQNRQVFEQFDCYGANDNRFLKYGVWYGIMLGVFGLYPPVWSLILSVVPLRWIRQWVERTTSTKAYASTMTSKEIVRIRWEVFSSFLFFGFLIFVVGVSPKILFLFYALSLINWSTRQFVEHAYTSLHPIEGALDLRHFSWMSWIMLHRELDLSHHRHPDIPWIYLPRLVRMTEPRLSYVRQYLRMWRGPMPIEELPPHAQVPQVHFSNIREAIT